MFQLTLTDQPSYVDEHNQLCYPTSQVKGLIQSQSNQLLEGAIADGYTARVSAALHTWVMQQVEIAAAERKVDLLEIGGGKGAFFDWVKESARTYINIEPVQLVLGKEALDRVNDPRYMCIMCSAEDIPLEDESVDVILSIASFDHIPDYRKSLAAVRRLLRKNGLSEKERRRDRQRALFPVVIRGL